MQCLPVPAVDCIFTLTYTYNLRETSTAIHNVNASVVVPSVARIRYV